MSRHKREQPSSHKIRKILLCLLLVLCLVAAAGAFITFHYLGLIDRVDSGSVSNIEEDFDSDSSIENGEDPNGIAWPEIESLDDDGLINIMLVGQDKRPEESHRARSDTMILCSINPKTGKASLVSFLRDLYVQIPGYSDNRLNAAFRFGGLQLMYETLQKNFGVHVDGSFLVDFEGFMDVIDILGGVDIELTQGEADYLGGSATAGWNHLDSAQALSYARIRYLDNDFFRTGRQRTVVMAAFDKIKGANFPTLLALMEKLLPCMSTDLTNPQIIHLATRLAPLLRTADISSYLVPANNTYRGAMVRGMSVLLPDLSAIHKLLETEYLPLS